MINRKLIRYSYPNISLDRIYSSEMLYPEWYKYIVFTEEIKDLFRSDYKTPSGKEYLKDNKEDYQQIKYKVYDMDIVQYINLKTGHHVYECEGHYFWEVNDNIHKSIDDFPILKLGLNSAIRDIWKPIRVTENGTKIWQEKEMRNLRREIGYLTTYKYGILHPIGKPSILY